MCHSAKPRLTARRGAVVVQVMIFSVAMLGMGALALDIGSLHVARTEMQRTADSAALAAAWELLDDDRLRGAPDLSEESTAARARAVEFATMNRIVNGIAVMLANDGNLPDGDVVLGYLNDPRNRNEELSYNDPNTYNSVLVRIKRDASHGGALSSMFANIFGVSSSDVGAKAVATLKDGVIGFQVTEQTGNAGLLPFALKVDRWQQLLAGTFTTGDGFTYNSASGTVSAGNDGILELNLYPGAGATQLPPGNFGTVDIGSPNNSTADISRQIIHGVNQSDLAHMGGSFELNDDGFVMLNGDTGLSAAVKDDLTAIRGQPRIIPLFDTVSGNGNNSMFRIVGFAGVRVMDVRLTGAMNQKRVIIQPAHVVDDSVITTGGSGPSYFVYAPARLTR